MEVLELLRNLAEVESEIKELESQRMAIRAYLTEAVTAAGGRIEIEGVGVASMSKPSTRVSYDAKIVDTIMAKALADGDIHTANALATARAESTTKGHLIVKAEK